MKLTTKSALLDLLNFIKKPNDIQINISTKDKFILLLKFLVLELIITFLVIIPIDYIIDHFIQLKSVSLGYELSTFYMVIILVVIFVPLIEELIFRSLLRYNSLFFGRISREKWNSYFPYLVYFFCIAFGFVHAGNYYNNNIAFYLLSPLIVLSQLSGAFVISYLRVRINFFYGFLYHAFWNLLAAIVIPGIALLFSGSYVDRTKDYNLSVEENLFYHMNEVQSIEQDINDEKIFKIVAKQFYLQDILNQVYGEDQYYTEEQLVNFSFISKNGISKEQFIKVLEKEYEIQKVSDSN